MVSTSQLVHVTDVLRLAGLTPTYPLDPYYRERGIAVHKACEYHDRGIEMDPESIEGIAGYLEAYKRFHAEMRPEILAIEENVVNEPLGYCGRQDRRIGIDQRMGILDIKSGQPAAATGPQTAAYLAAQPWLERVARWGLYLSPEGTYKLIEYKSRDDWRVFQSALSVVNWRIKHGLCERPERRD